MEGCQLEEADREAAYEIERQRRGAEEKAYFDKAVLTFLRYVVQGEQEKAEALLKANSSLALSKGTVTDLSKRTFQDITAFQYALWALDWHMWKMLLKYIPPEAAAMQFQELESKGTEHGKHFSLAPLICALNTYIQNFDAWYKVRAWDKIKLHWCQQIGGAQLLLPAHVINEYCRSDQSFFPRPSFTEEILPRTRNFHYGDKGEWFSSIYNGGTLGIKFGAYRSSCPGAGRGPRIISVHGNEWATRGIENTEQAAEGRVLLQRSEYDRDALQQLFSVRWQQLLSLKRDFSSALTPWSEEAMIVSFLN